jgi:hypothetical protein
VLGALAGEQESKPPFSVRRHAMNVRWLLLQLFRQRCAQLPDGADSPRETMSEMVPPSAQRKADGGKISVGLTLKPGMVSFDRRP